MEILPVIDILNGIVVHGIAGRRDKYGPIVSGLTSSHEPITVSRAIRAEFGLNRIYLADLDGILHCRLNETVYRRLIDDGFELLVDPGIHEPQLAAQLAEIPGVNIVVGLETCRSPADLATMVNHQSQITFSLDLFSGIPRLHQTACGWSANPDEIARQAVHCRVGSLIVLDLADVGMGTGGSTDALCQAIRDEFPEVRLIAGGGVRGPDDLQRFVALRVDAVLVASALHDGRLCRTDIDSIARN